MPRKLYFVFCFGSFVGNLFFINFTFDFKVNTLIEYENVQRNAMKFDLAETSSDILVNWLLLDRNFYIEDIDGSSCLVGIQRYSNQSVTRRKFGVFGAYWSWTIIQNKTS